MLGRSISHYRILEKLGGGGMGVVYRAEDTVLRRSVALKFLPEQITHDKPALERFLREARAAAALSHAHVCTVYEIGEQQGEHFIAMELLEGKTLGQHIGGRPLPINEVLELSLQLTDALEAAHERGIIHRDIKPSNIVVTSKGQAKILDFGLAKLTARPAGSNPDMPTLTSSSDCLTETGATMGTAAFMSPEQLRGEPLDARTDLFSLGAVLYEMVTGRQAFCGETSPVLVQRILTDSPPPASRSNPLLPERLEEIIGKALEKDRELRYQSAAEMRSELKRLKRDLESAALRTATGFAVARRRSNVLPVIIAAAAILAAVVVAIWWRLGREAVPRPELAERQLTQNPAENPVYAAAISPDGKYLAYADFTGVFLRLLETGETHALRLPQQFCFR